jgi:hypothetical protein
MACRVYRCLGCLQQDPNLRTRLLGSRAFGLMMKYGDKAANDNDLADYPAMTGARPEID